MTEDSWKIVLRTWASNPYLLHSIEDVKAYYTHRGYELFEQGEPVYRKEDNDPNFKGDIVEITFLFKRPRISPSA